MSRTRLSRSSETTTSWPVSNGICPPTSPVLPPCGTMAVLGRVGAFEDRRDLLRLAGLEHESGLAAIAVAPFDEIARHGRLVADRMLLADDAHQRIDRVLARRRVLLFACHGNER